MALATLPFVKAKDPTKCSRVPHPIKLPKDVTERDAVLRRAALVFANEDECRKGCTIQNVFESDKYKDKIATVASSNVEDKALEKIRVAIKKAQEKPSGIRARPVQRWVMQSLPFHLTRHGNFIASIRFTTTSATPSSLKLPFTLHSQL
jgi:hypothetical protein